MAAEYLIYEKDSKRKRICPGCNGKAWDWTSATFHNYLDIEPCEEFPTGRMVSEIRIPESAVVVCDRCNGMGNVGYFEVWINELFRYPNPGCYLVYWQVDGVRFKLCKEYTEGMRAIAEANDILSKLEQGIPLRDITTILNPKRTG